MLHGDASPAGDVLRGRTVAAVGSLRIAPSDPLQLPATPQRDATPLLPASGHSPAEPLQQPVQATVPPRHDSPLKSVGSRLGHRETTETVSTAHSESTVPTMIDLSATLQRMSSPALHTRLSLLSDELARVRTELERRGELLRGDRSFSPKRGEKPTAAPVAPPLAASRSSSTANREVHNDGPHHTRGGVAGASPSIASNLRSLASSIQGCLHASKARQPLEAPGASSRTHPAPHKHTSLNHDQQERQWRPDSPAPAPPPPPPAGVFHPERETPAQRGEYTGMIHTPRATAQAHTRFAETPHFAPAWHPTPPPFSTPVPTFTSSGPAGGVGAAARGADTSLDGAYSREHSAVLSELYELRRRRTSGQSI